MATAEWARDMATGDYVMRNGAPAHDASLAPPVRLRLRAPRKGWLYAPDSQYGSDFYLYRRRRSVDFRDQLAENLASQALEPMVTDGRIGTVEVDTSETKRGGLALTIRITDRQELEQDPIVVTPVGT